LLSSLSLGRIMTKTTVQKRSSHLSGPLSVYVKLHFFLSAIARRRYVRTYIWRYPAGPYLSYRYGEVNKGQKRKEEIFISRLGSTDETTCCSFLTRFNRFWQVPSSSCRSHWYSITLYTFTAINVTLIPFFFSPF
jgi:hypothetical protein